MNSEKLLYPSAQQLKFWQLQTQIETLLQQMRILNHQLSSSDSKNVTSQLIANQES